MRFAIVMVVAGAGVVGGCLGSSEVRCGDQVCAEGSVCTPDGASCTTQAQLTPCAGMPDATECSYPGTVAGVCREQVCITAGCGNGITEPGEVCDDGNQFSFDGCRADCLSSEECGDGIVDAFQGELCDCGTESNVAPTCMRENSDARNAECRPDCRPQRCGDNVIDGGELCDDGNTRYDDGCRGDCAGRFRKMLSPTTRPLTIVGTSGPDAAVVISDDPNVNDDTEIYVYDGSGWGTLPLPENVTISSPHGLYVAATMKRFIVIGTKLITFNNGTWADPLPTFDPEQIWGSGDSDIYTFGGPAAARLVYHWDGTSWTNITAQVRSGCGLDAPYQISALTGHDANEVYLAGASNGEPRLCRFDGTAWSGRAFPGNLTPDRMTVVGTAIFAFFEMPGWLYRGSADGPFIELDVPGDATTVATAGDRLLILEQTGAVLEYNPFSGPGEPTWLNLPLPTERKLFGAAASSATNVFLVGEAGTILH